MADIVKVFQIPRLERDHVNFLLLGESDGAGESLIKKVSRAALLLRDGNVPSSLTLVGIKALVAGHNYVSLLWGRQPVNQLMMTIPPGNTDLDEDDLGQYGVQDPQGDQTTSNGDIFLTTDGASDGDSYRILLKIRMEP